MQLIPTLMANAAFAFFFIAAFERAAASVQDSPCDAARFEFHKIQEVLFIGDIDD
jgi:hypothetical protein